MYTADPAQFEGVIVNLVMRRSGEEAIVSRAQSVVNKSNLERRQIAGGQLPPANEPGSYLVSAVVHQGQKLIGRVSRAVIVRARSQR